jgi:hypothetical protein
LNSSLAPPDHAAIKRWPLTGIAGEAALGARAALTEIDENLIRRDLTPAQRAKLVAKRKAAYEAVHPETKHGGARRGSSSKVENLKRERFTVDTAAKSGRSAASIARDATRAKALGPDLDRVAGTSLDKGAELDALAALAPESRAPIIERAAAERQTKNYPLASDQPLRSK